MIDQGVRDTADHPSGYFRNIRSDIAPLLPQRIDSVLEIGCGAGSTMAWLRASRPVRYAAAVEMSPEAGAIAREVFEEVEIGDAGAARFEFSVDRFQVILALDVLEHLANPEMLLHRLRGNLAPGGLIVVSLPNVSHYYVSAPLFFKGAWQYRDDGPLDRTHLRFTPRRARARSSCKRVSASIRSDTTDNTRTCSRFAASTARSGAGTANDFSVLSRCDRNISLTTNSSSQRVSSDTSVFG